MLNTINHDQWIEISGSQIDLYIKRRRISFGLIEDYSSRDIFNLLISKLNIFYVSDGGSSRCIKVLSESFFDEYNSFYKNLYEPKPYYVWYRIYWRSTRGTGISRRHNKHKNAITEKRDKNRCVVCRRSSNLTTDHIIPFSKSGDSSYYNLATLCGECNQNKGDKIIDGFIERFVLPNQLLT